MKRRVLLPFATATILFGAGCSLVFAAPSTVPNAVPAGTYTLDASHTNVLFSLSHMGFSHYYGRFNTTSGTLEFDPISPEKSKLNVTIDTASVDTNNSKLEEELKSPTWFDAAKYPATTFTSTKVEKLTESTGKVTGNLTFHGVTKPVVLDVTFNGGGKNPISNNDALGFSATTKINRGDFNVTQYLPMVGDVVTLTIETEFARKK